MDFFLVDGNILDKLEKAVLLFAIFHFAAWLKARSSDACAFEGLDNVYSKA